MKSAKRYGAGLAEYALLAGLIGAVCIGAVYELGINAACIFVYERASISSTLFSGDSGTNNCNTSTPSANTEVPVWSNGGAMITLDTANTDIPYAPASPTASDSRGSITYSIVKGGLPTGLTLNPNTGQISGTPSSELPYPATTSLIRLVATDGDGKQSSVLKITVPVHGVLTLSTATQNQAITLPVGNISVSLWGAGGANGGGNGGYTQATLVNPVGNLPQSFNFLIGGGGQLGEGPGAIGGGGAKIGGSANLSTTGGRGGGYTSMSIGPSRYLIAGGGGGGHGATGLYGGNGGGASGTEGTDELSGQAFTAGLPGTQDAGGVGGTAAGIHADCPTYGGGSSGSYLQGGEANLYDDASNGSGGGGYYGGGGGSDCGSGTGGGGSGYVAIIAPIVSGSTSSGLGGSPPANAGQGGGVLQPGNDGAAVIEYGP